MKFHKLPYRRNWEKRMVPNISEQFFLNFLQVAAAATSITLRRVRRQRVRQHRPKLRPWATQDLRLRRNLATSRMATAKPPARPAETLTDRSLEAKVLVQRMDIRFQSTVSYHRRKKLKFTNIFAIES